MAPRRREKTTTSTSTSTTKTETVVLESRRITRSIYKKQQMMMASTQGKPSKKIESLRLVDELQNEDEYEDCSAKKEGCFDENEGCSTPKSEKYKIPEIKTCPPAPKKSRIRRLIPSSKNCLLERRRRPITFFTHPDIDKFFTFAAR